MPQYNIHQAKTNLSKLLEAVERGQEVVIARAGKPVAVLVRPEAAGRRPVGLLRGKAWMADNFSKEDPSIVGMFENGDL